MVLLVNFHLMIEILINKKQLYTCACFAVTVGTDSKDNDNDEERMTKNA